MGGVDCDQAYIVQGEGTPVRGLPRQSPWTEFVRDSSIQGGYDSESSRGSLATRVRTEVWHRRHRFERARG